MGKNSRIMIINTIGDEAIVLHVDGFETIDGGRDLEAALLESAHSGAIGLLDLAKEIEGDVPAAAGIWVLEVGVSSSERIVIAGSRRAEGWEVGAAAQGRNPWTSEQAEKAARIEQARKDLIELVDWDEAQHHHYVAESEMLAHVLFPLKGGEP